VTINDNPSSSPTTKHSFIALLNKDERLLSHLFTLCGPRTRISVALVCRAWRKAALSSAQLWTTLDVPYKLVDSGALGSLLPRSANLPLNLNLQVSLKSNLAILQRHGQKECRRIQSLKLTAYTRLPYDSPDGKLSSPRKLCLDAKMPQLVTLEVVVPKPHANAFELPDDLFSGVAPQLHRLVLQNVLVPAKLDGCGALSRLTALKYAPGEPASHRGTFVEQVAQLLASLGGLESLVLTVPHGIPDQTSNIEEMHSTSLRSFELVHLDRLPDRVRRGFMSRLSMRDAFPALTKLQILFQTTGSLSLVTEMTKPERLEVHSLSFHLCTDKLRTTFALPDSVTTHTIPLDHTQLSQIHTIDLDIDALACIQFAGISQSVTTLNVNITGRFASDQVQFRSGDSRSLVVAGRDLTQSFPNVTVVHVCESEDSSVPTT